jgi:type IV secretory pathway VirB3-like protein
MERIWIIIAGLGVVIAAVFLWQGDMTVAFVAATLGVVAWFLSLRDRLRKTILEAEEKQHSNGDQDED